MSYLYQDNPSFIRFLSDNDNPEIIYFCPLCGGFSLTKEDAHSGSDPCCWGEPNLQLSSYIMDIPVYT